MTRHRSPIERLSPQPTLGAGRHGVIFAEDDPLLRGIISSALKRVNQPIYPVLDGLEAVMLAGQRAVRLVLLDISMPRLNGLVACEAIRSLPGYGDVPIVMLTGYDDGRLRRVARRLGATGFITKPFTPNDLLARLGEYLELPPGSVAFAAEEDAEEQAVPRRRPGAAMTIDALAARQNYQREIWRLCREVEGKA